MAVIHISEADAANDFAGLMAKVRAGVEIRIEDRNATVAIIHAPEVKLAGKTIAEALRLARARASTVTLDDQFGNDMEDIIRQHGQERLVDPWESF